MEEWRDIKGYEGYYQVSNLGRVKSLERYDTTGRLRKEKIIEGALDTYYSVCLSMGSKRERFKIHRLVANAFPEICGKWFEGAVINHKNEVKTDNRACNLEVCTIAYNNAYSRKIDTRILKYTINGDFVDEYTSIKAAAKQYNCNPNGIRRCCQGKQKTAYNYVWRYKTPRP